VKALSPPLKKGGKGGFNLVSPPFSKGETERKFIILFQGVKIAVLIKVGLYEQG